MKIEEVPGITAALVCDGGELTECGTDEADDGPTTGRRYVMIQSGQNFGIDIKLSNAFPQNITDIEVVLIIDGGGGTSLVLSTQQGTASCTITSVDNGLGGQYLRFTALNIGIVPYTILSVYTWLTYYQLRTTNPTRRWKM